MHNIGAVVLAAGRGTRLQCDGIPKVMCTIGGKPIVSYTVNTLKELGLGSRQVCLVIGYHREQVRDFFCGAVSYAVQGELLGTAHAAYTGIMTLPKEVEHVLVLGGDDSAFYTAKTLQHVIHAHIDSGAKLSLLSVEVDDPSMLGRVVRHEDGDIEVIEKEYVTPEQAQIHEVSTGTFVFDRAWFEDMFPRMPRLRKLGEYGLPTALAMCREDGVPYQVVPLGKSNEWFGINTREELAEADRRKREASA